MKSMKVSMLMDGMFISNQRIKTNLLKWLHMPPEKNVSKILNPLGMFTSARYKINMKLKLRNGYDVLSLLCHQKLSLI